MEHSKPLYDRYDDLLYAALCFRADPDAECIRNLVKLSKPVRQFRDLDT